MDVWPIMNSKTDKQFWALESATGSSAKTAALSPGKSPWDTARNLSEQRTIRDASPESSSSLEASSTEPGVVTGWVMSSMQDSRWGVTRG